MTECIRDYRTESQMMVGLDELKREIYHYRKKIAIMVGWIPKSTLKIILFCNLQIDSTTAIIKINT